MIDEANILTITPQFNTIVTNKYLRFNNTLLYATLLTLSVQLWEFHYP